MTSGTGKFFPANNYYVHLFNNSYEFMNNKNIDKTIIGKPTGCENDFHTPKETFDRMRADRDLWKEVAENLAAELGKKEYAHAEYENCKEVAEGVAW